MTKKKANKTKKTAGKKSSKKKSSPKEGKEPRPAEVHKEVSLMVHEEAAKMAQAVIDEGKKGQLATVKYLFEMSGVFPPPTEKPEGTPEEDCLAKTLLTRLNIPLEPVHRDDEDEEPVEIGKPAKADDEDEETDEGEAHEDEIVAKVEPDPARAGEDPETPKS
ncbi:MAG TPA: hypothetical protein VMD99_12120 [Terriglobales bacterium]|nr:hypothetical protein [Terriglobales bacterium]